MVTLKRLLFVGVAIGSIFSPRVSRCQDATASPDAPAPVALDGPAGRQLLLEAEYKEAFWAMLQNFQTQPDLGSCSVASCLIVLNSSAIPKPVAEQFAPFPRFTEGNFFTEKVLRVATREKVSKSGMSLSQITEVLEGFPLDVRNVYASDSTVDIFRTDLKWALSDKGRSLLANYLRTQVGQDGGGHFSPIVAYHARSDSVLIADTATYKYPWVWVTVESLWRAMSVGIDEASSRSRGYVLIQGNERTE